MHAKKEKLSTDNFHGTHLLTMVIYVITIHCVYSLIHHQNQFIKNVMCTVYTSSSKIWFLKILKNNLLATLSYARIMLRNRKYL